MTEEELEVYRETETMLESLFCGPLGNASFLGSQGDLDYFNEVKGRFTRTLKSAIADKGRQCLNKN